MTGSTLPNGTPATFTPAGSTTPITGTIQNGAFVPNAGQIIPTGSTTGPATGILAPTGSLPVNVPTNFSAAGSNNPSVGTPTATVTNPVTGTIGAAAPTIPMTGSNLPNGTPATFTPAGSTTPITGTIQNGAFVPTPGQTIPTGSTTGPATGTLVAGGQSTGIPTNFTAPVAASSSSSSAMIYTNIGTPTVTTTNPLPGLIGSPLPNIPLANCSIPNNTPATFAPQGTTIAITGTIINCAFVSNSGQVVPVGSTTGAGTGVLNVPSIGSVNVPTNIIPTGNPGNLPYVGLPVATVTNPVIGTVGGTAPNITLTGSNLPNGTPATFTPAGSTTPITGTIQNGVFVPNSGQTIPFTATTGPAVGTLVAGNQTVGVPTNFTYPFNNSTLKVGITDPYTCGADITGNVSGGTPGYRVLVRLFRANSTSPAYSFSPVVDTNNNWRIAINYTDINASNYVAQGDYTNVYMVIDASSNMAVGQYNLQVRSNCLVATSNPTSINGQGLTNTNNTLYTPTTTLPAINIVNNNANTNTNNNSANANTTNTNSVNTNATANGANGSNSNTTNNSTVGGNTVRTGGESLIKFLPILLVAGLAIATIIKNKKKKIN